MKALSIRQPWAGMIAAGIKTIETRNWKTDYRGDLLICASVKYDDQLYKHFESLNWNNFKDGKFQKLCKIRGRAIAVVNLSDCRKMDPWDEDAAKCDWFKDAYAWVLTNIRLIKPFAVKGQLSLFDVDDSAIIYRKNKN